MSAFERREMVAPIHASSRLDAVERYMTVATDALRQVVEELPALAERREHESISARIECDWNGTKLHLHIVAERVEA